MDYRKFTQRLEEAKAVKVQEGTNVLTESVDSKNVCMCLECGFTQALKDGQELDRCPECGNDVKIVHEGEKGSNVVEEELELGGTTETGTFLYSDEDSDLEFESPVEIAAYVDPTTGEVKILDGYGLELEESDKEDVIEESVKAGKVVRVSRNGDLVLPEGFKFEMSERERRSVISEAAKLGQVVKVHPRTKKLIINEGFALETEPHEDKMIAESYNKSASRRRSERRLNESSTRRPKARRLKK